MPSVRRSERRGQRAAGALTAAVLAMILAAGCVGSSASGTTSDSDRSAMSAGSGSNTGRPDTQLGRPSAPPSAIEHGSPVLTDEQYTPAVIRVLSEPRWFQGTDGAVHLVYGLELINGFPVPVTATQVRVRDADGGAVLQTLSGAALTASMSALAAPAEPMTKVPPSSIAVVWMDVPLTDTTRLPTRIEHDVTVSVPPGLPVPSTITVVGAAAEVDDRPPTVLGPPLTGSGWIALPSCCDGPHRRSVQPINNQLWLAQRFAIDFNKIDDRGFLATGRRSSNDAWFTYDQPVLAVADALVVTAVDQYDDQVPDDPEPVGIEEADGNHVILELGPGVYAFYAHLKPGSVSVTQGQRVTKGQPIGRTGNSGSSTGSHLHFQLMDRASALVADGLPFVFDQFTLTGRSPALDRLMALDPVADPVPVDPTGAGERTDQLPMSRDVVAFPDQ